MTYQTKALTYGEIEAQSLDHCVEYELLLGTIPPPVFTFLRREDYDTTLAALLTLPLGLIPIDVVGNEGRVTKLVFPSGNYGILQVHPYSK